MDKYRNLASQVAEMSVEQAKALRERFDHMPGTQLPGADEIGTFRALRAYGLFRELLTTRIGDSN